MLLLQLLILTLAICVNAIIFLYLLAQNNIFWTVIQDGTIKNILKGEDYVRTILSFEGHFVNKPHASYNVSDRPDWEVLSKKDYPVEYRHYMNSKPFLERKFGIHWVGLWPIFKVDEYDFEWTESHQREDGSYEERHRKERTDFLFAKHFQYFVRLRGIETKAKEIQVTIDGGEKKIEEAVGPSVDFVFLLTVAVNNGYKARFRTDDWLKQVTSAALAIARNYGGTLSYVELISEFGGKEGEVFSEAVCDLTTEIRGTRPGSAEIYGITIVNADLFTVEISAGQDDLRDATTRKYVAGQEADAKRISASGEADAIRNLAEAREFDIRQRYSAASQYEGGMSLAEKEAIRDSNITTYVEGGGAIPAISLPQSSTRTRKRTKKTSRKQEE